MDYQTRLALSYYEVITTINAEHDIYMVKHRETHKIYVKKTMSIYNRSVYQQLLSTPIKGVPRIYEIFEYQDTLCIIEEFISGNTLEDLLNTNNKLSNEIVLEYMQKLCNIVARLHALSPSIIHRDIKPSNIITNESGDIFLIDLNAAKFVNKSQEEDTQLIGTKGYAAPEQYGFGASTTKTDIYALGVLLNTLVTGDIMIKADETSIFYPAITKATKLDPEERYSSVKEFLKDIERPFVIQQNNRIHQEKINNSISANSSLVQKESTKQPINLQNATCNKEQTLTSKPIMTNSPNKNYQYEDIKTSTNSNRTKQLPSFFTWLPPGFRTLNPFHILMAIFMYICIFKAGYSIDTPDNSHTFLSDFIYRTGVVIILLITIFFSANYKNIHRFIPLCKSPKKKTRIWGIIIFDYIILLLLFGLLAYLWEMF